MKPSFFIVALSSCGLLSALGCGSRSALESGEHRAPRPADEGEVGPDVLEVSSPSVHQEHHAPDAPGHCPRAVGKVEDWRLELPASGPGTPGGVVGNVRVALDACENAYVAWDEYGVQMEVTHFPEDPGIPYYPVVARIFADGTLDWVRRFNSGAGENSFAKALQVDPSGNAIIVTERWTSILTPAGDLYPTVAEEGLAIGGYFLEPAEDDWYLAGPGLARVRFPSGEVIWRDAAFGGKGDAEAFTGFFPLGEDRFYFAVQDPAPNAQGIYAQRMIEVALDPGNPPGGGLVQLEKTSVLEEFSEYRPVSGHAVSFSSRRIYGSSRLEKGDAYCRTGGLRDIDQAEAWTDIKLCGLLIDLQVSPDGHLFSLWHFGSGGPRNAAEGMPVLLRATPDGRLDGSWAPFQPVFPTLMHFTEVPTTAAFALTEDSKTAVSIGSDWVPDRVLVQRLALTEESELWYR